MNHIHTPLDEQYKRDKPKKPWFKGFEKDLPLTTVTPDLNHSIKQIQYSQYMQCQGVTKAVVATTRCESRNGTASRYVPSLKDNFLAGCFSSFPNRKKHNEYITFLTYAAYNISWVFCVQFLGNLLNPMNKKTVLRDQATSTMWWLPVAPEHRPGPKKETVIFQPFIFRGELLVSPGGYWISLISLIFPVTIREDVKMFQVNPLQVGKLEVLGKPFLPLKHYNTMIGV